MLQDRRSFPRHTIDCPVEVLLPDAPDTVYAGSCRGLSRTSIQLECPADLIPAMLRQRTLPYRCTLCFTLPWDAQPFQVAAQLVTHRRLSQQHYRLVLLLRHADSAQEARLERLLAAQLPPGLD